MTVFAQTRVLHLLHCVIASIVKGVDVVALGSTDSGVPHEDCLRLLFLKNNLYVLIVYSLNCSQLSLNQLYCNSQVYWAFACTLAGLC